MRLGVQMTHIDELIGKGKKQITMDRCRSSAPRHMLPPTPP